MLQKRSPWISAILIVMLVALLGFSGLPRTISLLSENRAVATNIPNMPLELGALAREAVGYESVLEREPDNDFALSKLLEIRLQQKDFKAAINPLERMIELHPEQSQYRIFLAKTKLELDDHTAAETIYRQILLQEPANLEALTGIVSLFLQQERATAAINFLEKTLQETEIKQIEVDRTAIELLLAGVYASERDFAGAIATYDRAIATAPKDFRPLLSKALLLKQQGKEAESIKVFQQAKTIAPEGILDQLEDSLTE